MTDSRKRRILWALVAASIIVPVAGAGVYVAVAKPWRAASVEGTSSPESASLDAVAQALAESSATPLPESGDPLAFMNDVPAPPEAMPPSTGRYGAVTPVAAVDRYGDRGQGAGGREQGIVTDDGHGVYGEVAPLVNELPAEPEVARGQSPDDGPATVQPLANPLRDSDSRYGQLPALPDPPAAMAGETVNPLRPSTNSEDHSAVEPLNSEASSAEAAGSPTNPFARSMPEGDAEPALDEPVLKEAALERGFVAAQPPAPYAAASVPGTRSVLVNNPDSVREPSPKRSLVPVEPIAPRSFAAQQGLSPLSSEPAAATGSEGAGKPGERSLEGPQRSGLLVQKFAPAEIQIGKPCKFVVKVRNESNQPITDIAVRDEVPQGTRLISTTPTAETSGSTVIWQIGNLSPGEERAVEMQLEPNTEGQIGSVASVTYAAHASVRTICTRPELALRLSAPPQVLVGRQQPVQIEIHNPGTGDATGVMLLENVPENLRHAAGPSLEFEIGTLRAGETRQLELMLTADKPGEAVNRIVARGDGNLQIEESVRFEVIAPALEVAVEGPRRRFLDRPATYLVNVNNPGTAAAKDVQLVTKLPRGMQFVRANNMGEYDATTHSIHWSLAELPEGEHGSVELVAMPVESGQHTLEVEGRASEGLEANHSQEIQIEGLAAIDFEVVDHEDPIEVGGETTYEIRVTNQGTKAATNVRIAAMLPPGMNLLSASGETGHKVQAGSVAFDPIASLAPKADTIYRLQVQVAQPGDLRLAVEILTDDLAQPIRKEESTRVFGDE